MATKCFACRRKVSIPQYARTGDGKNRPFCPPCRKKLPKQNISRNTRDHFKKVSTWNAWSERVRRRVHKVGDRWFRVGDLIATQRTVSQGGIDHYRNGGAPYAPATVVNIRGQNYVWNGHHRGSVAGRNGHIKAGYYK